ncbi:hypothetical protein F5Y16DRAFT_380207 [Xylariaceae sp. FL0255]|nr:hypothetical protein F5Y16DRAFT_380207 [Xylariaceae sp. FL0255]
MTFRTGRRELFALQPNRQKAVSNPGSQANPDTTIQSTSLGPHARVDFLSSFDEKLSDRRRNLIQPSYADAVLIYHLGGGKDPDTLQEAGMGFGSPYSTTSDRGHKIGLQSFDSPRAQAEGFSSFSPQYPSPQPQVYEQIARPVPSRIDVARRHIQSFNKEADKYPCMYCEQYQGNQGFRRREHLAQHLKVYHRLDQEKIKEICSTKRSVASHLEAWGELQTLQSPRRSPIPRTPALAWKHDFQHAKLTRRLEREQKREYRDYQSSATTQTPLSQNNEQQESSSMQAFARHNLTQKSISQLRSQVNGESENASRKSALVTARADDGWDSLASYGITSSEGGSERNPI